MPLTNVILHTSLILHLPIVRGADLGQVKGYGRIQIKHGDVHGGCRRITLTLSVFHGGRGRQEAALGARPHLTKRLRVGIKIQRKHLDPVGAQRLESTTARHKG